jgi:hypothetical protein
MNAWLSGMSPAAAAVASAWSADGVVCGVAAGCVDDAVAELTGGFVFTEPPQPLSAINPARRIAGVALRILKQMLAPGA